MDNWFSTEYEAINWGKNNLFQHIVLGQLNIHRQKNEVGLLCYVMKINSKQIKDLNVRTKL